MLCVTVIFFIVAKV